MVSSLSSPFRSRDATRSTLKSGDRKCSSGSENARSPSSKDKDGPRYEFDSKIPKGHRTDRVKRLAIAAADKVGEARPTELPVDCTRRLKRLRTSRSNAAKRVASDNKEEEEEEGDAKPAPGADEEVLVRYDDADKFELEEREPQVADTAKEETPAKQEIECDAVQEANQEEKLQETSSVEAFAEKTDKQPQPAQEEIPRHAEPDTSLSLGSLRAPNRTKSLQSMSHAETLSYGVTTSLSLSCSHQFTHNPSCSLTHNSHDYQEFSSASQPARPEASQSAGRGNEAGDTSRPSAFQGKANSESNLFFQRSRPKSSMHWKQGKSIGLSQSAGSWERRDERDEATPSLRVITVREVVADPVPIVAQRMQSLPREVLEGLKASVKDLLEDNARREEFLQLQRILQSRNSLSFDALHMSHRTQLEILVAVKTGNPTFLMQENQLKPLTEVFLNSRCRNIQCFIQLPADNCECKICTQKNGFCNACMCIVCSKFDTEHSTCSWVGCDYCIHWCHTDCGLRKLYIKPGPTLRGTSEMQFHCVACGHSSELFGFVKEVFASCANSWSRGVLLKELDCAKRMFRGSNDNRGRQLYRRATQLITKLESNSSDVTEACSALLGFFEDSDNVSPLEDGEQIAGCMDPITVLERATLALQTYDRVLEEKRTDAAEMQYERARKKAEIEELESIVRIKQAEAKMFQARADEASREAEGLQRIVLAKCLKVEQEYAAKMSKLQLLDAEEKRKQKFEDLQFLERGSSDFDIMRKLMADLHSLLGNMEAAKQLEAEEVSGIEACLRRYLQSRVA